MAKAAIIDGKTAAENLRAAMTREVAAFRERHGVAPSLRVVLVGDDPASRSYVRSKDRMAAAVGIDSALVELPDTITEAALLTEVDALNPTLLVPCTPRGCLILVQETLGRSLAGQRVVVVGRSNIVGKPVAALLLGEDCTVTLTHSKTRDLPQECRRADILIAAVGRPELIRGDWIRPGATVIDVGVNRVTNDGEPRLVGDVAFAEAVEVAGAITPVPGGVGPMTVACLLRNTLIAASNQLG